MFNAINGDGVHGALFFNDDGVYDALFDDVVTIAFKADDAKRSRAAWQELSICRWRGSVPLDLWPQQVEVKQEINIQLVRKVEFYVRDVHNLVHLLLPHLQKGVYSCSEGADSVFFANKENLGGCFTIGVVWYCNIELRKGRFLLLFTKNRAERFFFDLLNCKLYAFVRGGAYVIQQF